MNDLFSVWEALNAVFRLGVVIIVVIKLTTLRELYNWGERAGLGIAGGPALLTVPVLAEGPVSPFSEWAGALFAGGVFIYFCGRLHRQIIQHRAQRLRERRFPDRPIDLPNATLKRLTDELRKID